MKRTRRERRREHRLAPLWSHMLPMLPACADAGARRRGALEQATEEAREYRRQASSRIVVPDGAGGALPGGGKIKL